MKLTMRVYQGEEDYWRIREFLRQVFLLNDRREISWHVNRLDYWRRHGIGNQARDPFDAVTFIWETADGRIASVLNPEGKGIVFLQVHPDLRTPDLEEEMLILAEKHLATDSNGQRKLMVFAHEHDDLRQDILIRRGYIKRDFTECHHHWPLSGDDARPIPDAQIPAGYALRALGDVEELPARSWVSWKAFHPDEPDEDYEGWEWYQSIQSAPLYRRDLDVVVVAPNSEFASFCTVWFDDVTRSGVFEPVGTAPAHQRRGLAQDAMYEGLRRLRRMGATIAYVGSESPEARMFYNSVGFVEYDLSELWEKEIHDER